MMEMDKKKQVRNESILQGMIQVSLDNPLFSQDLLDH